MRGHVWRRALLGAAVLCLLWPGGSRAQNDRVRSLPAVRTGTPPVIDGRLDDACWAEAPVATDFIDPLTDRPAQDQTVARLLYDERAIYVGIYAYDSQPTAIVARQRKDQVRFSGEDTVAFSIDPYGTHRFEDRNFFTVNPLGTKYARLAGGRAEKAEWIGIWEAAAQRTQEGWTVEMRIPWEMLSYPKPNGPVTMRINFDRYQQRTGERSWWSNVGVQERYEYDGLWTNVEPPPPAEELNLMPYVYFGGRERLRWNNLVGRAGLDLRYRSRRDLTILATVNPDFENVEQAVESIDFSYGARYVPDRRPFFQEGRDYFPFWFYSRSVEQVDGGLKAFGRLGPRWNLGLLTTYERGGPLTFISKLQFSPTKTSGASFGYGGQFDGVGSYHLASVGGGGRLGNFYSTGHLITVRERSLDGKVQAASEGRVEIGYQGKRGGILASAEHFDDHYPIRFTYRPFDGYRELEGWVWWDLEWRRGPVRSLFGWFGGRTARFLNGDPFRRAIEAFWSLRFRNDVAVRLTRSWERFEAFPNEGGYDLSLSLRDSDRYTNASAGFVWGRRQDLPYRAVRLNGNLRVGNLNLGVELNFVEHAGSNYQHTATLSYDITEALSLGGRMVWQKSGRNFYLALRRSGYAGVDFYLILGDPNAESFQQRLIGKIVLSL
ncbi:MAG: hypothetical protein KatS3mg115_0017 [Candidatus Poribacteria bacterium]|nr:MAG: hypothetical protein KatS3mg115_0017 [Candidatus Poribacteria bacterium]